MYIARYITRVFLSVRVNTVYYLMGEKISRRQRRYLSPRLGLYADYGYAITTSLSLSFVVVAKAQVARETRRKHSPTKLDAAHIVLNAPSRRLTVALIETRFRGG